MLVVVYERGLHLSHVLPFFFLGGLLASSSSERRVVFMRLLFPVGHIFLFCQGWHTAHRLFGAILARPTGRRLRTFLMSRFTPQVQEGRNFFGWPAVALPSFLHLLSDSCSPL